MQGVGCPEHRRDAFDEVPSDSGGFVVSNCYQDDESGKVINHGLDIPVVFG